MEAARIALGRLFARRLPSPFDGPGARLAGLRQVLGWLAPAATAFAVLAAGAGAAFRDRSTIAGGLAAAGAVAVAFLLSRRLATRVLDSLDDATAGRERLEAELAEAREAKEEFRSLAYHDGLTGLPNRSLFHDRLGVAIAHTSRQQGQLALLYLDIDDFKAVNDSYGHANGDRVLVEVAGRIRAAVRAEDTVARLGGDEFIVLLAQVTGAGDAGRVSGKVLDAVRAPIRVAGHDVSIAVSLGVSVYPGDGLAPEELVSRADRAMYRAKQRKTLPGPGAATDAVTREAR